MLIHDEFPDLRNAARPRTNPKPKLRGYEDEDGWSVPPDCTVRTGAELMERVGFILEAMKEETWLPASLRGLILDGFLKLRQGYRYGELSLAQARETVSNMAMGCYVYNDLTMRSKTLRHVRVLDMELTGFPALGAASRS